MTVNERALAWCREELQRAEEWATESVKHGSDDDLKEAVNAVEETGAMVDALEKQVPKQITDIHCDEYFCPACGSENNCDQGRVHDKYCPQCGQKLAWKKEGDE